MNAAVSATLNKAHATWIARQVEVCEAKSAYSSMGKALHFANRNGFPMHAYRCPVCASWHLSSKAAR